MSLQQPQDAITTGIDALIAKARERDHADHDAEYLMMPVIAHLERELGVEAGAVTVEHAARFCAQVGVDYLARKVNFIGPAKARTIVALSRYIWKAGVSK